MASRGLNKHPNFSESCVLFGGRIAVQQNLDILCIIVQSH